MKFTAIKINAIGDNDPKYGQRYWGEVEESQMPVSFNLMTPVDIPIGASLEFEERTIKETGPQSKNPGSEYLFLKKVKVGGGLPLPAVSNDSSKLLELIYEDTQAILKILRKDAPGSLGDTFRAKQAEKDTVVEDIGDDPIDTSMIPF